MAEKENPYQNAHAESLWSRLKAELLEDGCFENLQDAQLELFDYIEGHRGAGIIMSGVYTRP